MGGLLGIAGITKHFRNEARMLSKLSHPVCRFFTICRSKGHHPALSPESGSP